MQAFRLIEKELDDGRCEVRVEGELDLAVAGQLSEMLASSDGELVAIDLAACEFIDSTGLAIIVQASEAAAKDGRRVVVHSPTAQVLRVLTVTGLTANGLVFASREEACASPNFVRGGDAG
jgi:anti-sigma B factor antagonist